MEPTPKPKPLDGSSVIPEILRNEALPDIVLPERIRRERESGILNLINHPPQADVIHVLGRSGPLAAAGIYEDADLVENLGLPPMMAIDGIGNEVWLAWKEYMRVQGKEEEIPDGELGDWADPETRTMFNTWVRDPNNAFVQGTVGKLREAPMHGPRIAIVDDMRQSGNVTLGVAPALYEAAYGSNHVYDSSQNRYMFTSSDWLSQIIHATFVQDVPNLDARQTKLLVELSKGSLDWPGIGNINPSDMTSIEALLRYCASAYIGQDGQGVAQETVYEVVRKYGTNIFDLHTKLLEALRRHTQEVLRDFEK